MSQQDRAHSSTPHSPGTWTLAQIPDQAGRRALITGANSGIGLYTALELARRGAHILLCSRDLDRGNTACEHIRAKVPNASIELIQLDLASLDSVRSVAAAQHSRGLPLDLLILNAGVMAPKTRKLTRDGFELQFGTNVLGHFALTAGLMPLLRHAAETSTQRPRVVTIASIAHKRARLNFDDLQSERAYNPMGAYAQTKLADLMFSFELDRRLRSSPEPISRILSIAAHPGVAATNLFQAGEYSALERLIRRFAGRAIGTFLNTSEAGALPTLYAATAPEAQPGGYYGPQGWREMRGGDVGTAQIAPQALDRQAAVRLWGECERLTHTRLP